MKARPPQHIFYPTLILLFIVAFLSATSQAFDGELQGELKDAWLTGKAETVLTLNKHLNRYPISARVNQGAVNLNGKVGSEIDKSLAGELMRGIADISLVKNNLAVDPQLDIDISEREAISRSSFARWINDLTTTAVIRSRLVSNANVPGLSINVETRRDIVTLKGEVESEEASALAEEIARNTGDVVEVRNNLLISSLN